MVTYTTIDELNISSPDQIFVYLANEIPFFTPGLLLGLWFVLSLSIYYGTRRTTGNADFFVGMAASGFFVAVIGVILSLVTGAINTPTLVWSAAITIVSFVLLMLKRDRD